MERKKGLSLLILTITILVMIILASVVIFISANTTNNSKKAAFASDLEQLEDLVREYYLANNSLPIVTDATIYSKSTFTALITDGKDMLISEIAENGDDDAVFYKLDLSKLDVKSSKRGLEEAGETDVYYVASNTFNVYYLMGEEIANEYYFSISERLTGKAKVANNQTLDTSNISVTSTTGAITLTKNTAEYTNALTVTVKVTLEAGETMKYTIAGQEITVEEGTTTIDVANIVSSNSSLQSAFYQSEANKYILAQKYSSGTVVAEVKMNISNLDILSGNISSASIGYTKYDKFILGKISGYTDLGGSGVKETRVLYLTNKSGDAYYTNLPETITKEYVKQTGKTFTATSLKLPTDVKTFALVFIDNAGNMSEVVTFDAEVIDTVAKDAIAKGIQIGDEVKYPVTAKTYTPNAEKTGYKNNNTLTTQTNLKWIYIGVSEKGELLITPDVSSAVTENSPVYLNASAGYITGPEELNTICDKLYTVDGKGIARSMNIDDVTRILGYTGEKGAYYDSDGNYVPLTEAMKIGDIEEVLGTKLSNRSTPESSKKLEEYYSDLYTIEKVGDVAEMQNSNYVDLIYPPNTGFGRYWLANRAQVAVFSAVSWGWFAVMGVDFNHVSGFRIWQPSAGGAYAYIRPVVALTSKISKNSGVWEFDS